jgi:hypothetical protein
MLSIVKYFWQVCLLRAGPDRLPTYPFVLGIVLAVYMLIAIIQTRIVRPDEGIFTMAAMVAVAVTVQGLATLALLAFKNHTRRFIPTLSALLGSYGFVVVIQLPFLLLLQRGEPESLRLLADSVTWICLGWWLAIAGHIYHNAVNISILQGSAFAFLTELLGVISVFSLFPSEG